MNNSASTRVCARMGQELKRPSTMRAFTLIEVIVALAIAGGALVLLLSANQASLRKSVRANQEAALLRAAESQFDACRCGAEDAREGDLEGMPGWTWRVQATKADIGGLKHLERLSFLVFSPEAPYRPHRTFEILRRKPPEKKP